MSTDQKASFLLNYYRSQQKRYPSILWQGDGSRREIALTFDDGPHPKDTPQVLEALAKHEVHATFFLVGKHVERYPQLVRQIHQNGHRLGIHCYRHLPFPLENTSTLRAQLERTRNAIAEACGISPETICHVRPPYGAFTTRTLSLLEGWGYCLVMWNSIPPHWMQPLHWTIDQVIADAIPGPGRLAFVSRCYAYPAMRRTHRARDPGEWLEPFGPTECLSPPLISTVVSDCLWM